MEIYINFGLVGIISALVSILYRDTMFTDMIFEKWYNYLSDWVHKISNKSPTRLERFKAFVAYPLGYCIYCSNPWITIILSTIFLSAWEIIPKWQDIVLGYACALGISHFIVIITAKFILKDHPDLWED